MKYEKGSAIFLPIKHSLRELRQATKQALLNHHSPQAFKVLHEELYYPMVIAGELEIPEAFADITLPHEELICGEESGIWNCISLIEMSSAQGMLLHKHEEQLYAACLPFLDMKEVNREHRIMQDLFHLADGAENIKIHLNRSLPSGSYSLKELLQYIARSMI